MNVIVKGPLLSVSGYGVHARQVWQWARSKPDWNVYATIVPWGQCTYYIDPEQEDGVIGDVMARSSSPPAGIKADLSLQVLLPDEWDPALAKKNVGITAGIEADKCNPAWVGACNKMDKVIVPSVFSKSSFLMGGLDPQKIVNVPEAITCGVKENKNTATLENTLDGLSTSFNFLVFGQLTSNDIRTDRKNSVNCMKWICEALKDDPDVGIILKTNMGRMTQQDRAAVKNMTEQFVKTFRSSDFPRIHIIHGLLDKNEVGALYRHPKVKALATVTRGEGWGLPILDAAASGLPVIAPACSGHVDFMKHVKYLDVKYKRVPIPDIMADGRIWIKGTKWFEPEEKHFKARISKFRKQHALPAQWAGEAIEKVNSEFSLSAVFKKYDSALREIL